MGKVKAPILYPAYETEFANNGYGFLTEGINCLVAETINADFELTLTYPITGIRYKNIVIGNILLAPSNPYTDSEVYSLPSLNPNTDNWQPFRIYRVEKSSSNTITAYAEHISYEITGFPCLPNDDYAETETGAGTLIDYIQAQANEAASALGIPQYTFEVDNNLDDVRKWQITQITDVRSVMMYAASVYGGEWEYNERRCKLWKRRGGDRFCTIRYGTNMQELKQTQNCETTYTHIMPYYTDGDNTVYIAGKYLALANVPENAQKRVFIVNLSAEFDEEPTPGELLEAAQNSDAYTNPPIVELSQEIRFVVRGQTAEYSAYLYETDHVELGDSVSALALPYGIDTKERCNRAVYDVYRGMYDKIILGAVKSTFTQTIRETVAKTSDKGKNTVWFSVGEPREDIKAGDYWYRIDNEVDRNAQALGKYEGGVWKLGCKFASGGSGGVGRNVGGHNEIFNVNEGEADSSTINGDSRYDYNHATGRGHTINGSNNTSVGGYHNSVSGGYCLNVYGAEITVAGLNPRCSWIAGDTLTVQGSGITSSVIVGQSSTVSTSNCQANIISVFSGTIGGDIYSSIIETQNSTVLSMDSSIFVGKYSNIGGYIFCSAIFGYDHAISTAYQALVSGRGASVTNNTRMAIGDGTKQSPENIFHIDANGNVTAESYNTNSADFAEMFEWADGNRENADRRGMLVALYGDMILPAHGDEFFGVVSAAPSVVGNNPQHWHGKYKKDIFGAEIKNKKGERIESDEYDPKQEYIPRSERPEWAVVGMVGRLIITDDGSCKVGGYVSARHGIGTKCYSKTGAKVLKRIDDHHVEVLLIAR